MPYSAINRIRNLKLSSNKRPFGMVHLVIMHRNIYCAFFQGLPNHYKDMAPFSPRAEKRRKMCFSKGVLKLLMDSDLWVGDVML